MSLCSLLTPVSPPSWTSNCNSWQSSAADAARANDGHMLVPDIAFGLAPLTTMSPPAAEDQNVYLGHSVEGCHILQHRVPDDTFLAFIARFRKVYFHE